MEAERKGRPHQLDCFGAGDAIIELGGREREMNISPASLARVACDLPGILFVTNFNQCESAGLWYSFLYISYEGSLLIFTANGCN